MFFAFVSLRLTLIYQHEIVSMLNTPKKSRGRIGPLRGPDLPRGQYFGDRCSIPMVGKMRLADMFCVALLPEYLKLIARCYHIFNVLFRLSMCLQEFVLPNSLRDLMQVIICETCTLEWTVFDTRNWFCGWLMFLVFCQWLFCWTSLLSPALYKLKAASCLYSRRSFSNTKNVAPPMIVCLDRNVRHVIAQLALERSCTLPSISHGLLQNIYNVWRHHRK